MIRVLHTSDLHGRFDKLLNFMEPFDLWIDTGDFFPNAIERKEEGGPDRGVPAIETPFQREWIAPHLRDLANWLGRRPMLSVPGNHDFTDLAGLLRSQGADAQQVTTKGVDLFGIRFAGFRDIPFRRGEWACESHDLRPVSLRALDCDPDVLLTHAPPAGILEDDRGDGNAPLATALSFRHHKVRAHFFGHSHRCGGKEQEINGIRFFNGAQRLRTHMIWEG